MRLPETIRDNIYKCVIMATSKDDESDNTPRTVAQGVKFTRHAEVWRPLDRVHKYWTADGHDDPKLRESYFPLVYSQKSWQHVQNFSKALPEKERAHLNRLLWESTAMTIRCWAGGPDHVWFFDWEIRVSVNR